MLNIFVHYVLNIKKEITGRNQVYTNAVCEMVVQSGCFFKGILALDVLVISCHC